MPDKFPTEITFQKLRRRFRICAAVGSERQQQDVGGAVGIEGGVHACGGEHGHELRGGAEVARADQLERGGDELLEGCIRLDLQFGLSRGYNDVYELW